MNIDDADAKALEAQQRGEAELAELAQLVRENMNRYFMDPEFHALAFEALKASGYMTSMLFGAEDRAMATVLTTITILQKKGMITL